MRKKQLSRLCEIANSMGGNVIFTEEKTCFNSDSLTVYVPFKTELEDLYGLAHEIGHLKDHLENGLDYELWRSDSAYRLNVEMRAWTLSFEILTTAGIDTSKWSRHVSQKLSSYMNFPYQSLDAQPETAAM